MRYKGWLLTPPRSLPMLQSDETALLPLNCYFYVCYLRKIKSSQMLERNTQSTRNCLHGKKNVVRLLDSLLVAHSFICYFLGWKKKSILE